jgi:hypothetical protein
MGRQTVETHRKLMFQLFERHLPMGDDSFPHFITARNVCIDEGLAENHTQLPKFGAFDDSNGLEMRQGKKSTGAFATYLIVRNDKADKVVYEHS